MISLGEELKTRISYSRVPHVVPELIPPPSPIPIFAPQWFEVPQRVYKHDDKQCYFKRSEPMSFNFNGLPGISMGNALRKQFMGLGGRDDPTFRNTTKAISCRFLV